MPDSNRFLSKLPGADKEVVRATQVGWNRKPLQTVCASFQFPK